MDTLLKVVRWVLGLFLGFTAFGGLVAGAFVGALVMLGGMLIVLPPSGAWIGRFVAPVARHGAAIGIGLLLWLTGIVVTATTAEPSRPAASKSTASRPATHATSTAKASRPKTPASSAKTDIATRISPDAVMLIEGEGWDKTRREWGSAGIKRLNTAMPKVAEKVARTSACDQVELVGISDRSKPRQMAVFYVDCRNGQRFYVSEADLASDAAIASKSEKTAAISDANALQACEASVKGQLTYPLSFNRDLMNTRTYRAPTGNIAVEFTFKAMNALGAELPQRARCVIDDTGIHPAEISNR